MKKILIGLIIATFLMLALAYSVVIPPFEGLDETEHFGVARYVADTGQLPVQGDPALAEYHVRQEASQPPLYYLLAGPLLRFSRITTDDTPNYLQPNPYVACGEESIRANKAVLRHDPYAEAFPWHGALLALHLLRVFSIALQTFTLAGVYAIARRVFPQQHSLAILAVALTAFNPQFLIVASNVNNDNIATPIITWALYVIVLVAQEGISLRRLMVLGILIGLAALSKLTGLLLLPLAAVSIFNLQSFKAPTNEQQATTNDQRPTTTFHFPLSTFHSLILLTITTLIVSAWWYIRNWQLYGDPTGLSPMLDIVGRRGPVPLPLLLAELTLVFRSYWGQFPCAFFDSALYYSAWALVAAWGLIGLLSRFTSHISRLTSHLSPSTFHLPPSSFLPAWLALVLIGWLRWNLTTPAPGGRLLFSAVGATSVLLAYGLTWRWPRLGYAGTIAMISIGLIALPLWINPLFAPPPMRTEINPQRPLNAQFGDNIGLAGYDLQTGELGPGRYLDITLYWRALKPMETDYTLALQLAALAPGDMRTLLNFNTWPGGGNLPTAAWPVGRVIADHYRVPLPRDTGQTQAWRLQVILYDARNDIRLPLTLDAQPAGDTLALGTYRVQGASEAALPVSARLAAPVTFDAAMALTHAQIEPQANGVRVRLLWTSLQPFPQDVTVFVHAYDATGVLAATGDGPPMNGNFPTSLWQSGDLVLDEHLLILPGAMPLENAQIAVGLYRQDGARLAAVQDAVRLPNDAAIIGAK